MKFRVWCDDIEHWLDVEPTEAQSADEAAREYINDADSGGIAFPEENEGDTCTVNVCEWEEHDEDNEPEPKRFTFKLIKERRVELQ